MRLAVSNIAWPPSDCEAAYEILRDNGIKGLEIAPALYLPVSADPFRPSKAEVDRALARRSDFGIELVSLQSLLYGISGAAMFGTQVERARFDAGMIQAIDLAGTLGVKNLVFGSPRQRAVPTGLDMADAWNDGVARLRGFATRARLYGARIAVEANSAIYGTNFLTKLDEAAQFVRRVDHPAAVLNLDLGSIIAEDEFSDLDALIAANHDIIGHVQISEPALAPAPANGAACRSVFATLARHSYSGWVSLEMAAGRKPLHNLATAIRRLRRAAEDYV